MDHEPVSKSSQAENQKGSSIAGRRRVSSATACPVLELQSALGNQVIGRIIQAKLRVSEPGDVYEQEADRVADQVMRSASGPLESQAESPTAVQLKCAPCEASRQVCPECEEHDEEEMVARQTAPGGRASAREANRANGKDETEIGLEEGGGKSASVLAPPPLHRSIAEQDNPQRAIRSLSGGQPLPENVRNLLEPRFGVDFRNVRVHTDGRAAESAQALNALAYTIGSNVVFAAGQFAPDHPVGQRLLAHELTHVIQQSRTSGLPLQRKPSPATAQTADQPLDLGQGFSVQIDRANRKQIYYFEKNPWVTISFQKGARLNAKLESGTRSGLNSAVLQINSESAVAIEVDRDVQEDVLANRLGDRAAVGYEFTCPGTLTGLVTTEEAGKTEIRLPARYLLIERRPGALVIPKEGELPSDALITERREIWEHFEMPDSFQSFDNIEKLRKFLSAKPKGSFVVLRMPDGRFVAREVSESDLRRIADAARRSRYHPEELEGIQRYRGNYARGNLEAMILEGIEYANLDALANSYYEAPDVAGEGQKGDPIECEIFHQAQFSYGRKALTHQQAVTRWQQFDRMTRAEVFGSEAMPGHKFAELWVKGVGSIQILGMDYFFGRDQYADFLKRFDQTPDLSGQMQMLDSLSDPNLNPNQSTRAIVEFLYTEANREVDNPSFIVGLKARESVLQKYSKKWNQHVEISGQHLAIDLLSDAVAQIRKIADSDESMRRFLIGFSGLEAKRQQDTLHLLGVPDEKVAVFQALLVDKKTAFSVALGNEEGGVSIKILRGMADKNLHDIEGGIKKFESSDVVALRLKGDFGNYLRAVTYKKFGFHTLDPATYPHRNRTPDFLPSPLSGNRAEFSSLGEQLFAAEAKHYDSVDTIEKIFIGLVIAITTVVLVLLFNVAGAFIAEAVFGLAAGTTANLVVGGAIAGFLTAGAGLLTEKYVFGKEVSGREAALQLLIGTLTGAAFGGLGRLLKTAGTALRLGIEASAFLALSLGEFYRVNSRLPTGTEWYWLIYENALNFALLQAGSVLARPMIEEAGFWSRAIRLGGQETRINNHIFEVQRLNRDVAAFAADPQRTPFQAAQLKAKQIELLNAQRKLIADLQSSYRTRPEAQELDAQGRKEVEDIGAALRGLEVTDILSGLKIKAVGESETVFEYQPGPDAAAKFSKLFPNAKIDLKPNGQVEVFVPGEKEPFLFVPTGAEIPATVSAPGAPEAKPKVNINTATAEELAELPGIGSKRAEAIVEYREKNGEFKSVDEIASVPGIGSGLKLKLLPLITTVEGPPEDFLKIRDALTKRQDALLERADRLGVSDPTIEAIRKNKLRVYSRALDKSIAEAERLIADAERVVGAKMDKLSKAAFKRVSDKLKPEGMAALRDGSLSSMSDTEVGDALAQVKGLQRLDVPQLRGVLHAWRAKVDLTRFFDIAKGQTVYDRNFALETFGRMSDLGIPNCGRVIADMGRSGKAWDGGMWAMESARYKFGLENIREFEERVTGQGDRRDYDIVLKSAKKIELKNWFDWDPEAAAKLAGQFIRDVKISGNDPDVFGNLEYLFRFPAPRSPEWIKSFLRDQLRPYVANEVTTKSIDADTAKRILEKFDAADDLVTVSTARRAGSVPGPVQRTPIIPPPVKLPDDKKEKEEENELVPSEAQ